MAFEADCSVSTVLEALFVESTSRFLVPGNADRHRHADWGLPVEDADWGTADSKFEIRNSKSVHVLAFPP